MHAPMMPETLDRRTIVTAVATAPLALMAGEGCAADTDTPATVDSFAAIARATTHGAATIRTRGWQVPGTGAATYRRTSVPIERHAARSAIVSRDGYVYTLDHDDAVEVDQFGAMGDDRTNDRDAVQAAIDYWCQVGGTLRFTQGGRYFLGSYHGPSDRIFMIDHVRNAVIDGRSATLRTHSSGQRCQTYLFTFRDFRNLTIRSLSAMDSGTDIHVEWRGLYFVSPDANLGDCDGLYITNVTVTDAVAFLYAAGTLPQRIRNVHLRNCTAIRCYYGIVFAENGDHADIELSAINCRRAYFCYGVTDHTVRLTISHDVMSVGADACCLIKRYVFDTRAIAIAIRLNGNASTFSNLVKLEHQPTSGGISSISDISIDFISVRATGLEKTVGVGFSSYTGSTLQLRPTENQTSRISISGRTAGIANLVKSYSPTRYPISIALRDDAAARKDIPTSGYAIARY